MNWVHSGAFKISNANGRHYVFHRNNEGNTEINIPNSIFTKAHAKRWLKNNPNAPRRVKMARKPVAAAKRATKSPNYWLNERRAKGENIPWSRFTCDLSKQLKVFKPIGKGRQGVVFMGSRYSNGRYPFAIKISAHDLHANKRREAQPSEFEFKIHQAAAAAAPAGVIKVHQLLTCTNFIPASKLVTTNVISENFDKNRQTIILLEYCSGGSLKDWLKAQGDKVDDSTMRGIISQVLKTILKIKDAHPDFSHNDLHLENLFVTDRGVLIGDFGWARLEKKGTNPAVNTANGTRTASFWGVGPQTDPRYDHHLFLNELVYWIKSHNPARFPLTNKFLDMAIPLGYRGQTDLHVSEWRLKYGDPCPGLPSLRKLVSTSYVSGAKRITSPNLMAAKARLRRTTAPPSPKKARPTATNAELVTMSAANFLKLNPKTRERAKALRAAAAKKPANKAKKNIKKNTNQEVVLKNEKRQPIPAEVLKSAKFNKLIETIWKAQGAGANESFYNSWNRARTKALNKVAQRIATKGEPFTPSPPKPRAKTPSPPKPRAKTPSPPKPRAKTPSPPKGVNLNYKMSPKSGRVKIRAPNSGRYVYANGQTISLAHLKTIASKLSVNIKGLRSKANIVKMIFSVKNK